jgi:hypothetical protein
MGIFTLPVDTENASRGSHRITPPCINKRNSAKPWFEVTSVIGVAHPTPQPRPAARSFAANSTDANCAATRDQTENLT